MTELDQALTYRHEVAVNNNRRRYIPEVPSQPLISICVLNDNVNHHLLFCQIACYAHKSL